MPRKGPPYLTKSRFIAGIYCPKRLWLDWHDPLPYGEAAPGTPQAVGTEVGTYAYNLFPGGVLIDEAPYEHEQALERTRALMAGGDASAIFEAAFDYDGVRIRADVLERDAGGGWHLHEVKSSTGVKETHIADVAVQYRVLKGCEVDVVSAGVMHINNGYVRGVDGIDWASLFTRTDVTEMAVDLGQYVDDQIGQQKDILDLSEAPDIPLGRYCKACDFQDRCTGHLKDDWVLRLPRLTEKQFDALSAEGIEWIADIPEGFRLNATQERVRSSSVSGEEWVSPDLGKALRHAGPPAFYLDFETMSPAIPIYPGTRPYQRIPFQWSLHHMDNQGTMIHREFLAEGKTDPRRDFAERMIEALGISDEPVIVYSSFEKSVIGELIAMFPDLTVPLSNILKRLFDLLPVTRGYVYLPAFGGSFSIKTVGPALAPDVSYDDLEFISDGQAAAGAFVPIANGELSVEQEELIRKALLDYCELDTLAMVRIHQALTERVR